MPIDMTGVYRFQLTPDDDFHRAAALVPYLKRLGISHLYTSPIAECEPGSVHGYDVVDPTRVRAEIGGEKGLRAMTDALAAHGMGWILDIVPNHVSIQSPDKNPWFWDVLTHGRDSAHADLFDIEWEAPIEGRLVLPVLSDYLDNVLAAGAIVVDREAGHPEIVVDGHLRLPVAPGTADDHERDVRDVLADQHYRLVFWQRGLRNMRRFFEIDTLAALAIERPHVRDAVHELTLRLLRDEPTLTGVRVDHLDGLADPDEYLRWLRTKVGPDRTIHVEKILVGDETLPERWPVDGTTGYEFARLADQLLMNGDGARVIAGHWASVTGEDRSYHDVERSSIEEVLADRLAPDVARLQALLGDRPLLIGGDGRRAIIALLARLGRYRTYLPAGPGDADLVRRAGEMAVRQTDVPAEVMAQLVDALTAPSTAQERNAQTRFQQLSGPALAKGGEDRALYRWTPVPALNEVGADPAATSATAEQFHAWAGTAQRRLPRGLLTTTTHDTKRSGDVRARLLTLTADPQAWTDFVDDFVAAAPVHPVDAYLLAATMFGAWPIDSDRLSQYMVKALREAALRSSWINPDVGYEAKVDELITSWLGSPAFVQRLEQLVANRSDQAIAVTMAQIMLRLTAPGVGDVYRGDELLDLSLVDPDNRRPVDWERYGGRLNDAASGDLDGALDAGSGDDGLFKLTLISRVLALRAHHHGSFGPSGGYEALAEDDPALIAYRRGEVMVVVARVLLTGDRRPVDLPPGTWHHRLLDGRPALSGRVSPELLVTDRVPVAMLEREPG